MALVTLNELKAVLNIGDLYPDAVLEQVIGAAESTVLSLLQRYGYAVDRLCCTTANTIRLHTTEPYDFYVGQTVRLQGLVPEQYNGAAVVATLLDDQQLEVTKTHGEPPLSEEHPLIPTGRIYDDAQLDVYDGIPEVREAATAIAVDIFQSRQAPGGQINGIDFTPGPYRLGRSLFTRVSGLLARWTDTGTLVG
jgi:hypothetical protein